jgi:hypothetical protein
MPFSHKLFDLFIISQALLENYVLKPDGAAKLLIKRPAKTTFMINNQSSREKIILKRLLLK